jgi:hypothetical protein
VYKRQEYCQRLRVIKSRFALKLGAPESVSKDIATFQALAADGRDAYMQAENLGMLLRLGALNAGLVTTTGPLARLEALCDAVGDRQLDTFARLVALMGIAEFRIREGSLDQAKLRIDQVNALVGQLGDSLPIAVRASSSLLHGLIQLHGGQADAAVTTLRSAHRLMSGIEGAGHPVAVFLSLDLAIAIDATGDTASAARMVAEAESALRESVGPASSTYRRFQNLAQDLQHKLESGRATSSGSKPLPAQRDLHQPVTRDFFI